MALSDDVFTVFISHKHDDHALAVVVKNAMEGLGGPGLIDCFVSGIDITAGMDWRREIRTALARSHLLVLLFTTPSKNWDWCLYETGLYTRFDMTEVGSVVCLFSAGQASPSPLADLQGVPAETDKVRAFLDLLCRKTWKICDDWRQGALAPEIAPEKVETAARAIAEAFRRSGSASTYYPCHRVVLSLSESDDIASGIPENAWVVEGPSDTSGYTMSLFDLASGTGRRTWGDLLRAVQGTTADWRRELDSHFLKALREELFPPIASRMRAACTSRVNERLYLPTLYSIVRGPAVGPASNGVAETDRRPRSVTIVLTPEPPARDDTVTG
jgi:TIR domain-containing protein